MVILVINQGAYNNLTVTQQQNQRRARFPQLLNDLCLRESINPGGVQYEISSDARIQNVKPPVVVVVGCAAVVGNALCDIIKKQ